MSRGSMGGEESPQGASVEPSRLSDVEYDATLQKTAEGIVVDESEAQPEYSHVERVSNHISNVTTAARDHVSNVTSAAADHVSNVTNAAKDHVSNVTNAAKDHVNNVTIAARDHVSNVTTAARDHVNNVSNAAKEHASNMAKNASDSVGSCTAGVGESVNGCTAGIKESLAKCLDGVLDIRHLLGAVAVHSLQKVPCIPEAVYTADLYPPMEQDINYHDENQWYNHTVADEWTPKGITDEMMPCKHEDAKVLVFYVHCTIVMGEKMQRYNQNPDERDIYFSAEENLKQNGSIFNAVASGHIFSPKYRACTAEAYNLGMKGKHEEGMKAYQRAVDDILHAFDVFMEKYCTEGRPFILAGQSQGAEMIMAILKERVENNKDLMKRLVCAYALGTQAGQDTTRVPVLKSATQVNGFVTWNTMSKDSHPPPPMSTFASGWSGKHDGPRKTLFSCFGKPIVSLTEKPVSVNPLTWLVDDYAWSSKKNNLGAVVKDTVVPNFCGCKLDENSNEDRPGGALLIDTSEDPKILSEETDPNGPSTGDYHCSDFAFFWMNIRQNAIDRTNAWHEKYTPGEYYLLGHLPGMLLGRVPHAGPIPVRQAPEKRAPVAVKAKAKAEEIPLPETSAENVETQ